MASKRGNVEICRLLLQFGANKENVDNRVLYFLIVQADDDNSSCFVGFQLKETPVHRAPSGGNVSMLQLLKETDCSLEVKNQVSASETVCRTLIDPFCVLV